MACGTYVRQRRKERQVMNILTNDIENNDIKNFKEIVFNIGRSFFIGSNDYSFTLYAESMKRERKEIFDFLLSFHGRDDEGTIAALEHVLKNQNSVPDYFVNGLLNKYTYVENDEDLLVRTATEKCPQATKLLLDKGLDANAQMGDWTPLHRALMIDPDNRSEELITTLLCYGADPSVEAYNGYNCFELAMRHAHTDFVREMLFDFTFDYHSHHNLHISVLLQLGKLKSPLFHQLIKHDVEFFLDEYINTPFLENLSDLLLLEFDYFKIIFQKYNSICFEIFKNYIFHYFKSEPSSRGSFFGRRLPDIERCLCAEQTLMKFNLLLHGPASLNKNVIDFISTLDSYKVFSHISKSTNQTEVTEIFVYLLTWGLRVRSTLLDCVFQEYGYCELFKLLLFMDVEHNKYGVVHPSALVFYICEINSTLDTLSLTEYTVDSVFELMNYFVHPKLDKYRSQEEPSKKLEITGNYPHIPSLVEIARNTFREYFVTKFDIKNAQQFYTLLNRLPISVTHKKIISLETKLYNV
ncbi:uncharacterized protein LOC135129863 [Zophobas morio]|uniref:uncharacterized protein LOC135129863 n=1 Tax=Zophobas morio TaxID=2755281 RepID=UPI0030839C8B